MLRLILVSILVASTVGEEMSTNIVGGSNAVLGQFPYQVSLRGILLEPHFCGGSIITNRWVLSAAHCTIDRLPATTMVVVGTISRNSGGVNHLTLLIYNHPQYNSDSISNDVSVIQTVLPITFTLNVKAIEMGSNIVGGGVGAIASGWGKTSQPGTPADDLQFLATSTLTNTDCRSQQGSNGNLIFDTSLCTFTQTGQGICLGDSGGPLTPSNQGSVIGIASWVIPCAVGRPDVWARVSKYRTWILETIQ